MFRFYCEAYINSLPSAAKNYSTIVHLLNPTPEGQPLEIITYTTLTGALPYENLQSEIVEHLLAAAPKFGLTLYQKMADPQAMPVLP